MDSDEIIRLSTDLSSAQSLISELRHVIDGATWSDHSIPTSKPIKTDIGNHIDWNPWEKIWVWNHQLLSLNHEAVDARDEQLRQVAIENSRLRQREHDATST